MAYTKLDLRDDFDYQPPTIAKLVRIYDIVGQQRWFFASALFITALAFMLQWTLNYAQTYGYPWLGFPLLLAALWMSIAPPANVARIIGWTTRREQHFLTYRDIHWIAAMVDRHPVLHKYARPYLESTQPVPVSALHRLWSPLVREEERRD